MSRLLPIGGPYSPLKRRSEIPKNLNRQRRKERTDGYIELPENKLEAIARDPSGGPIVMLNLWKIPGCF